MKLKDILKAFGQPSSDDNCIKSIANIFYDMANADNKEEKHEFKEHVLRERK